MRRLFRNMRRSAPGQVLITFALMFMMLLVFVGLAVDVGFYLAERRAVQNAADAAAMAGARVILLDDEPVPPERHAYAYVTLNGYTESEATATYDNDHERVTVEISHDVPKFFIRAVYPGPWQVSAKAVAGVIREVKQYGLIALGETNKVCDSKTGIEFGGDGELIMSGDVHSNDCITFDGDIWGGDPELDLAASNSIRKLDQQKNFKYGTAVDQALPIPDPLKNKIVNPLEKSGSTCESAGWYEEDEESKGKVTLYPGRFEKQKDLPNNMKEVTLKPGEYCFMDGVTFHVTTSLTTDPADGGVLLYFESTAKLELDLDDLRIKAHEDPNYQNVVIWSTNCNAPVKITGNTEVQISGVIYAPCSPVEVKGGPKVDLFGTGAIIGWKIKFSGNPDINISSPVEYEAEPPRVYLLD